MREAINIHKTQFRTYCRRLYIFLCSRSPKTRKQRNIHWKHKNNNWSKQHQKSYNKNSSPSVAKILATLKSNKYIENINKESPSTTNSSLSSTSCTHSFQSSQSHLIPICTTSQNTLPLPLFLQHFRTIHQKIVDDH